MREIKFRAWDKNAKQMIKPGDIVEESELMVSFSGKITEEHNNHACGDPECCGPNENYLYENSKRYVLMQFTGLLDKNGKEIYEGDIVGNLHPDWTDEMQLITDIRYLKDMLVLGDKHREIIGNIYENSSLLESEAA